jgi:hypothetical protein
VLPALHGWIRPLLKEVTAGLFFWKESSVRCYGFGVALNGTFHMSCMNLGAANLEFNV